MGGAGGTMLNEGRGRGEAEERRVAAENFSDLVYVVFELIANYRLALDIAGIVN